MPDTLPPYIPRISEWKDLPEAADPNTVGADMVVKAEDVNGWQERLQALTALANANASSVNSLTSVNTVLEGTHLPGDQLVHNGTGWVTASPASGQVLTSDPTSPTGHRFLRPHDNSLYTGDEVAITISNPATLSTVGTTGGTGWNGETVFLNNQPNGFHTTDPNATNYQRFQYKPLTLAKTPNGGVYATSSGPFILTANKGQYFNITNAAVRWNFGQIIPPAFRPATNQVIEYGRLTMDSGSEVNSQNLQHNAPFRYAQYLRTLLFSLPAQQDPVRRSNDGDKTMMSGTGGIAAIGNSILAKTRRGVETIDFTVMCDPRRDVDEAIHLAYVGGDLEGVCRIESLTYTFGEPTMKVSVSDRYYK